MTDSDSVLQKETEEKILAFAERYAEKKGFILNPDRKELADVISGLSRNKINSKKQYCPCRLRTGDKKKDREIICPCIYHEDEIERDGHCHCMVFFKK
ncbi:ferredoxin-thioredoxin reductase catalytic domain-containing protein [Methanoplanus limicola]|uniref:ferredoxin:thioredoxin reductase n=1 Tax=Methanoplanus limicola DSM 2279 TaxID=937775 RepID=H1Z211_9EURY|nr:ferredoxin-thioredoxin reductase catalytic domain-containing protein [Methanoplanus limicola]EHQ36356.1 ferredoxin thioredoxin reductase beta chain [Methanoplanus limicola DSM 2279]